MIFKRRGNDLMNHPEKKNCRYKTITNKIRKCKQKNLNKVQSGECGLERWELGVMSDE